MADLMANGSTEMRTHATCTHASTPGARGVCRRRQAVLLAEVQARQAAEAGRAGGQEGGHIKAHRWGWGH